MKNLGAAILVTALCVAAAKPLHAQAAVYGEFSAVKAENLQGDNWLYGATTGLLVDGPSVLHHRLMFSADLQGEFAHKTNFSFNGVTIGPRVSFPIGSNWRPFGEFLVGFARLYHPQDQPQPTTDATIQFNGGLSRRMTSHVDLTVQAGYGQYYALGGEYNPKTFSMGATYYFRKR